MATQLWKVWLNRRERDVLLRVVRGAKGNEGEMDANIDCLEALEAGAGDRFQAAVGIMKEEDAVKWQLGREEWMSDPHDDPIAMTVANARTVIRLYKEAVNGRQITTQTGFQVRRAIKRIKRVDEGEVKTGEAEPVSDDVEATGETKN